MHARLPGKGMGFPRFSYEFCSCLFFEVENYWQNLQPLTLDYGYNIYLPYPQILFPLNYKKNVNQAEAMPVVYFSFRYICNWFLYSHTNTLKSFHLILKHKDTDVGQSPGVLFQKKSDPSEKNLSEEGCFYQMLWPFAQVLVCKISFSLMLQFSRKLPYTPEPTGLWSSALDIIQSINNDCWSLLNTSVNKWVLCSISHGCQPLPVFTAAAMGSSRI